MDFSEELEKEFNDLKQKATPLNATKFVVGTLISLGAAAAVAGMMKGSLKNVKGLTKIIMKLGIFMLGCKAGDVAEKYFNDTLDDIIKTFKEAKEEMGKE